MLPGPTGSTGTSPSGGAAVPVSFSIEIPSASPSSKARGLRYVSAGTKSVSVTYAGSTQAVNCAATCSFQLTVVPGTATFTMALFDASNATGHMLANAQTTATVVAGQNNAINVTFEGVVASVALSLGTATVTAGTPATIPVIVTAKDAAGYTIIGSDPYAAPISLSDDDTSGGTSLSASSVVSPASSVTLAYNGSAGTAVAHVTATVAGSGVSATAVTLNVQSTAETNVPVREATWYSFGLNGVNAAIPPAWMAAHTDYVEADDDPSFGEAFKDAGGKFAAQYTDPAYVPYCFAPFTPGTKACIGQIGAYATDEGAWFHGADGTRVRRFVDSRVGYQEALNPASPSARAAYHQTTTELVASSPKLDYFFADDSSSMFVGDDGTVMSGWFYNFNAPATEITTDAAFIPAMQQMFAASTRPLIVNGIDPGTLRPSYNGQWLDSPNVAGQNFEGCYSDGTHSGIAGETYNRWVNQSNGLLLTYAHHSKAVCMMYGGGTPAHRIYDLASWWMTYTEPYAIAAPTEPTSDGYTVVPEFDIVPHQPRASATTDVAALRSAGGAYVREFAACYQGGKPIGPCAAVVNESPSNEPLPSLAGHYANALVVDDRSTYTGGTAAFSGAIPSTLPPMSALVLR